MGIEFGNRLAKLRKEKGLTQEELAEKVGVSRQTLGKWESGEVSPETENIVALAKALEISTDELLGNVEEAEVEIVDAEESAKEERPNHIHIDKDIVFTRGAFTRAEGLFNAVGGLLALVAYLIVGFTWKGPTGALGWACGWTLLLLPPVIGSVFTCLRLRRYKPFHMGTLVILVYCGMGIIGNAYGLNLWHPYWILFFLIPLYHYFAYYLDYRWVFRDSNK